MDRANLDCRLKQFSLCIDEARKSMTLENSPQLVIAAATLCHNAILTSPGTTAKVFRAMLTDLARRIPAGTTNTAYSIASLRVRIESLLVDGEWDDALKEARRLALQDTQFQRRGYLGAALEFAAHKASDSSQRRNFLTQARAEYAKSALHPSEIWVQPTLYSPGAVTDDLLSFLRVSQDLGVEDAETHEARDFLQKLRPSYSSVN